MSLGGVHIPTVLIAVLAAVGVIVVGRYLLKKVA